MCRLAAYLGDPIPLRRFLLDFPHSLYQQSWDPQELAEARLNADGYGVAWRQQNGGMGAYTQPMAIWNDVNLPALADALVSDVWLGNVRSATPGQPVHAINTQPFAVERLAMTHNGYLSGLASGGRGRMLARLSDTVQSALHGTTDSEYLFALLRQALLDGASSPAVALEATLRAAAECTDGEPALLNICLTDGESLVFSRHAIERPCPSLYMNLSHPRMNGGLLLASERLDDDAGWQTVPPHTITTLRRPNQVEVLELSA